MKSRLQTTEFNGTEAERPSDDSYGKQGRATTAKKGEKTNGIMREQHWYNMERNEGIFNMRQNDVRTA